MPVCCAQDPVGAHGFTGTLQLRRLHTRSLPAGWCPEAAESEMHSICAGFSRATGGSLVHLWQA